MMDSCLKQIQYREFIKSIQLSPLSLKSKKQYETSYKKIRSVLNGRVIDFDEEFLINMLRNIDAKPETKSQMVSVILLIRRNHKLDVDDILFYRGTRVKENGISKLIGGELYKEIQDHKVKSKIATNNDLPTMRELETFLENLYKEKKYGDYILNYLLIHYGVRNKDLDILCTFQKKVISKTKQNVKKYTHNYLYPTKYYCWFIVNEYKTSKTYGRKKIRIRDRHFQKSVIEYIRDGEKKLLLNPVTKKEVTEEGIGRIVKDKTYKKIGEGRIFKAIIKHILSIENMEVRMLKLHLISDSRGTSPHNIIQHYATDIPI